MSTNVIVTSSATQVAVVNNQVVITVGTTQGPAGTPGVGVPAGGTTGQVLAKASNTNYDTQFVTVAGTGTVTSVSAGNGTGLAVGTATSTPALTVKTPVPLTSTSGHIATDTSLGIVFTHVLTENTVLDNPTNLQAGAWYTWRFTQATSAKTLSFGTLFKWPGAVPLTLSTGSGAVDIITALYIGGVLETVVSGQAFA